MAPVPSVRFLSSKLYQLDNVHDKLLDTYSLMIPRTKTLMFPNLTWKVQNYSDFLELTKIGNYRLKLFLHSHLNYCALWQLTPLQAKEMTCFIGHKSGRFGQLVNVNGAQQQALILNASSLTFPRLALGKKKVGSRFYFSCRQNSIQFWPPPLAVWRLFLPWTKTFTNLT